MSTPDMPSPARWPMCPECEAPWALRRCITLNGSAWLWTRDCKHKKVQPVPAGEGDG